MTETPWLHNQLLPSPSLPLVSPDRSTRCDIPHAVPGAAAAVAVSRGCVTELGFQPTGTGRYLISCSPSGAREGGQLRVGVGHEMELSRDGSLSFNISCISCCPIGAAQCLKRTLFGCNFD
ncbi:hypothetical protein Vafri_11490 [Volvox africanus]|nr:hypothetical protein Vafri_11490 [Volvox africanus]